ncbi:MAG: ATP-dependent DNA helicase RecQ [Deltaproteobacteria bacterium]|nr:ATP-dependent DNA helicase RecQ [Deltaproteobacteria bacterium]
MSSRPSLEDARELARSRFRVQDLFPEQENVLCSILDGRDTLAVLPTGAGKSLCYQVPAYLADRPTVTVSPLIALMRDQERSLMSVGAPVVRIDSTLRVTERRAAVARVAAGGPLVVLTTPETLERADLLQALSTSGVSLLCIDEAHCISEWGHDFRPSYLRLGAARETLGNPVALALTATATPRVRDHIVMSLRLDDPNVVNAPPHRPNLRLEVEHVPGDTKLDMAGHILRRLTRPGIVYCATTVSVDQIYIALRKAKIPATHYHGKMRAAEREANQKSYMHPRRRRVMVATSAFGMGIDKPNIRYIAHYQLPGSLEQYVQEAGRAGRDGRPSQCVLLYDPEDMKIQEHLMARSRPSTRQLQQVFAALTAWILDERPVNAKDLALSAQVQQVTARAGLTALEEMGVVQREKGGAYSSRVTAEVFASSAGDLIDRYKELRMGDERRLRTVSIYADHTGCRSAFLRAYFGEEDPPECGICDVCAPRPRTIKLAVTVARKPKHKQQKKKKGKRRRRRKKKGAQAAAQSAAAQPQTTAAQPQTTPDGEPKKKKRRRRRRRRRRKNKPASDQGEASKSAGGPDVSRGPELVEGPAAADAPVGGGSEPKP